MPLGGEQSPAVWPQGAPLALAGRPQGCRRVELESSAVTRLRSQGLHCRLRELQQAQSAPPPLPGRWPPGAVAQRPLSWAPEPSLTALQVSQGSRQMGLKPENVGELLPGQ